MKHNIRYISLATILTAATMLSCDSDVIFEPTNPFDDSSYIITNDSTKITQTDRVDEVIENRYTKKYTIVVGDTSLKFEAPKLPPAPSQKVNVEVLKSDQNRSKPFKMITIGGSLTAGVRDFGYFNEGIYTAYPNLLARQLTIESFRLPLFSNEEYNGVDRLVESTFNYSGGPIPKYNYVSNNTAIRGTEFGRVILNPIQGDFDNVAIPYINRSQLYSRPYDRRNPFAVRFFSKNEKGGIGVNQIIKDKEFDFFVLESGYDLILSILTNTGDPQSTYKNYLITEKDLVGSDLEMASPEHNLIQEVMAKKGAKGILLTTPNLLNLPFLIEGKDVFTNSLLNFPGSDIGRYSRTHKVVPTSQIDSLMSPRVNIALKPGISKNYPLNSDLLVNDYIRDWVLRIEKESNEQVKLLSEKYGYGVADIRSLYEELNSEKGIVLPNGQRVSKKEFFSSDGMYPSAIGQQIITNVIIEAINSTYNSRIPPIEIQLNNG